MNVTLFIIVIVIVYIVILAILANQVTYATDRKPTATCPLTNIEECPPDVGRRERRFNILDIGLFSSPLSPPMPTHASVNNV